jgi:hypothetical protein
MSDKPSKTFDERIAALDPSSRNAVTMLLDAFEDPGPWPPTTGDLAPKTKLEDETGLPPELRLAITLTGVLVEHELIPVSTKDDWAEVHNMAVDLLAGELEQRLYDTGLLYDLERRLRKKARQH